MADVLVSNWSLSRPAAFDLKVINPLNSNFLLGASMTSGYTAELGEKDKYPKMTFPVQREVGSVSHWSWRYLVVGEMRHKKPSQGLPKS